MIVRSVIVSGEGAMDINMLKQQTSAEHDRVEDSMRVMDGDLDLGIYVETLQRLYGFVLGWEQWASNSSDAFVQALVHPRQRSELLYADLRFLSVGPHPTTYPGPALSISSQAHVLGGLYVMEGSTLGGQYIARHVEATLALSPGFGDSFFRGYGDATGKMWREVKEALTAIPDAETEQVIFAAKSLFRDFALWNEDMYKPHESESIHA